MTRKYVKRNTTQLKKTVRACRMCDKKLKSNRYYNCDDCVPVLPSDEGDLVYFDVDTSDLDENDFISVELKRS